MIEFKDFETAKACYDSMAYQDAKALRDPVSAGDMQIIEGYEADKPPPALLLCLRSD